MSDPVIILHVGQHKTGSKALQFFMARNRKRLKQLGVLYPEGSDRRGGIEAYTVSHYKLYALMRMEIMRLHGDAEGSDRYWKEQRPHCHPFTAAEELLAVVDSERKRSGVSKVVLSAEDLFDMRTAHELSFSLDWVDTSAKLLARCIHRLGCRPLLVVCLRRQDHLLAAHYGQYVKGSLTKFIDFQLFAKHCAPRLHAQAILSRWSEAFGAENLRVLPYEPVALPAGIVPAFFSQVLGFEMPADISAPPLTREAANISLDRDHLEFLQVLHGRSQRGEPTLADVDVLDAALKTAPGRGGIDAWWSPEERRDWLAAFEEGNAGIAAQFLGGDPLFKEPMPQDQASWNRYAGLTSERAVAIACEAHACHLQRLSEGRRRVRSRRRWILSCALGALLLLAWACLRIKMA